MTDDSGTSSDTSTPVSPLNCLYFKLPTAVGLCAGSTVEQQHPALQAAGGLLGNHSTKQEGWQ